MGLERQREDRGAEAVREHLLLALHLGRLREGSRIPSVRALGRRLRLNPKTVHRAYLTLEEEGWLETRPGSGTFLREDLSGDGVCSARLMQAAERCGQIAERLGLSREELGSFLVHFDAPRSQQRRLLFTECNHEQLQLIAGEVEDGLRRPVERQILSRLRRQQGNLLRGIDAVVTTDCHREEVQHIAAPLGLPVYRVALTTSFPQALVDAARRGSLLMLVRDARFGPIFDRLLESLGVERELRGRIRVTDSTDGPRRLARLEAGCAIYLSPLLERGIQLTPSLRLRRIDPGPYVERRSIEELGARLALRALDGGSRPLLAGTAVRG